MPAVRAERLCPEAIFIPPDFARYKAASSALRETFQRHTDLIEPLSLDEAHLDVTENKMQLPTATGVAKMIREQIREELNLTASAEHATKRSIHFFDQEKSTCDRQRTEGQTDNGRYVERS